MHLDRRRKNYHRVKRISSYMQPDFTQIEMLTPGTDGKHLIESFVPNITNFDAKRLVQQQAAEAKFPKRVGQCISKQITVGLVIHRDCSRLNKIVKSGIFYLAGYLAFL